MRVVACAIVCWCVAGTAGATTLYRCVGSDGIAAYQDSPCSEGRVTTRTIPVTPIADAPETTKSKRAPKSTTPAVHRRPNPRANPRSQQREVCSKAKAERQSALERVGLRRTFDQLRALDDVVHEACKGV